MDVLHHGSGADVGTGTTARGARERGAVYRRSRHVGNHFLAIVGSRTTSSQQGPRCAAEIPIGIETSGFKTMEQTVVGAGIYHIEAPLLGGYELQVRLGVVRAARIFRLPPCMYKGLA